MTDTSPAHIAADAKAYILEPFLISTGLLDSLATLPVVGFLEGRFGIEPAAHEAGVDDLNTISDIAALVASKRRA